MACCSRSALSIFFSSFILLFLAPAAEGELAELAMSGTALRFRDADEALEEEDDRGAESGLALDWTFCSLSFFFFLLPFEDEEADVEDADRFSFFLLGRIGISSSLSLSLAMVGCFCFLQLVVMVVGALERSLRLMRFVQWFFVHVCW